MTSADYVPFINSTNDAQIAKTLYADAVAVRVSLETASKMWPHLPNGPKRWIDPSVDGLHMRLRSLTDSYQAHIKRFTGYDKIADAQFQANPVKEIVRQFVFAILDTCNEHVPDWIGVPQLPQVDGVARNKINKMLAESTNEWKQKRAFAGRFILPAVFTNQRQINKKTDRNKKLGAIMNCYMAAGAHGIWIVDATLNDQEGSSTFDRRFSQLKNLHEEVNEKLPEDAITICGPYWGMNLVLWARGLVRFMAIGLGSGYKYNFPGMKLPHANVRVALTPLRRWATATPRLRNWLTDAIAILSPKDPAGGVFAVIEKTFPQDTPSGKMQVASFYKKWFHKFSSLPRAGRPLALYQDLSNSYVLGSTLNDLPPEERAARKPGRVAQQLMMNCL
jgi:hypothetical protein